MFTEYKTLGIKIKRPIKEILSAWEADYKIIQEKIIHSDSLNFADLMASLTTLKNSINASSWKINGNF